jgi:hypothetical protein
MYEKNTVAAPVKMPLTPVGKKVEGLDASRGAVQFEGVTWKLPKTHTKEITDKFKIVMNLQEQRESRGTESV